MRSILRRLLAGELTEAEAEAQLRRLQIQELDGRARLDLGRGQRRGLPEVVLASGKSPQDTARLVLTLAREQGQGLASRMEPEHWAALRPLAAEAGYELKSYGQAVRVLKAGFAPEPREGRVAVLTAGTSDFRVAEEALVIVEACGMEARLEGDLGVAGLHRLLGPLADVMAFDPDILVVAAGMDGVLPGVVSGLVEIPVIGVPVSTGYGLGGRGEGALLTMLQSCSTGLVVMNIDNGIGAGAAAVLIAGRAADRAAASRAAPSPGRARASRGSARPGPRA